MEQTLKPDRVLEEMVAVSSKARLRMDGVITHVCQLCLLLL